VKSIHTLIPDINYLLSHEKGWFTDDIGTGMAGEIRTRLTSYFGAPERAACLRMSKLGEQCPHALWYSYHHPELAEPLPPWTIFKLSYGHVIEAMALALAKAAGHTVEGEQDELILDGITGHRDAVIDGCIVDVKSTTKYTMEKLKRKVLEESDSFAYLDQLDAYLAASAADDLVINKTTGYIWGIERSLGHMVLYEHKLREASVRARIAYCKRTVESSKPPDCMCRTEPHQSSGNIKLGTVASYSPYKYTCFPNLRCFLYSSGPVYLTRVVRTPEVPEINRQGRYVDAEPKRNTGSQEEQSTRPTHNGRRTGQVEQRPSIW
jgi:hypothetical protein